VLAKVGSPPTAAWLDAFVTAARSGLSLSSGDAGLVGPRDVAWAPLHSSGLVVVAGRDGPPFRSRGRQQLQQLCRVADARWLEPMPGRRLLWERNSHVNRRSPLEPSGPSRAGTPRRHVMTVVPISLLTRSQRCESQPLGKGNARPVREREAGVSAPVTWCLRIHPRSVEIRCDPWQETRCPLPHDSSRLPRSRQQAARCGTVPPQWRVRPVSRPQRASPRYDCVRTLSSRACRRSAEDPGLSAHETARRQSCDASAPEGGTARARVRASSSHLASATRHSCWSCWRSRLRNGGPSRPATTTRPEE